MAVDIQVQAAKFANSMLAKLNQKAVEMAGVEVMWFRAHPQERSTDVIFQSYTLHNVDECPVILKAIYSDAAYDDAALTFSFNGIDYKPSLTLEIPIKTWIAAADEDGTIPQEKDIVFIPQTNKLWQVKSMTPVASMAGQITSYKTMLETYRPEADRHISGELKDAIEANTLCVDKLFGAAIDETLKDLTNDKQSSQFSSTERDKYKDLSPNAKGYCTIMTRGEKTETISDNVELSGHIAARSYYNMSSGGYKAVEYKNIHDEISSDDSRCLSVLVRMLEDSSVKERYVTSILENTRNRKYVFLEISTDTKDLKSGDTVIVERGVLSFYGCITDVDSDKLVVMVPVKLIRTIEDAINGWEELDGYYLRKESPVNLLSGESENGDFEISLYGGKYISIVVAGIEYFFKFKKKLEQDRWYGFIINLQKEMTVDVFDSLPELSKIYSFEQKIAWEDDVYTAYYIKSSNSNITNIRLYDMANSNIDKQLEDLVSYNVKNGSHAIINDSADLVINNKYYGEQR